MVVPLSRSNVVLKLVNTRGSRKKKIERYWPNALSFCEVKATSSEDCKDFTATQCLRYTRKIVQYWAFISHTHFLTWCGNLVRLWYVNASIYGCSRAFDTKDTKDQEHIIKLLRFLNLEEHQFQLCGFWDIAAETELKIRPDTVTSSGITSIKVTKLEVLDLRPGPFRSRTVVFFDRGGAVDADEVLMVKGSWQAPHLETHELTMLCDVRKFPEECRLPYPPEPYGLLSIPNPWFQADNSEPLMASGPKPNYQHRIFVALATKQRIGILIDNNVLPHHLAHIHMELAEQLLILASHGYHYRDLNEGNIRLLKGSTKTLLIIDMGNMRKNLSPGGRLGMTDAEAIIDRASDDTRSATEIFLPSCYVDVEVAIRQWNGALNIARVDSQTSPDTSASGDRQKGLKEISRHLRELREALKKIAIHSHRYIDDLESAVYLHFWRTANYHGLTEELLAGLIQQLALKPKKELWAHGPSWQSELYTYCERASLTWRRLMSDLRTAIHDARTKLNEALALEFEAKDELQLERLEVELLTRSWDTSVSVKNMIYEIFENRGLLNETGLHPIERECFNKCIELLGAAATKMEADAFSVV